MTWWRIGKPSSDEPTSVGDLPRAVDSRPLQSLDQVIEATGLTHEQVVARANGVPVLPPYTGGDGQCGKCGATGPDTRYVGRGSCVGPIRGECLMRTCTTCGYQWAEAVNSPDSEPATYQGPPDFNG